MSRPDEATGRHGHAGPEPIKIQEGLNVRTRKLEDSAAWLRFVDLLFIWFLCPFCVLQAFSGPLDNDKIFGGCLVGGGWAYLIVKTIRRKFH